MVAPIPPPGGPGSGHHQPLRPVGSFLELASFPNAIPGDGIAPIPEIPGWLRVRRAGRDSVFPAQAVQAAHTGPHGCEIVLAGGYTVQAGPLDADQVLAAMTEAQDNAPLPEATLPHPLSDAPVHRRVVARRATLLPQLQDERVIPGAFDRILGQHLGLLRDHALNLAGSVSHPRDWLLLLRDAAAEAAAAHLAEDRVEQADAWLVLMRQIERDARDVPPEAPRP